MPNHALTLLAQMIALPENILETATIEFPSEIPVLLLSSEEAYDRYETERKEHMNRLGEQAKFVVVLAAKHNHIYFHRDCCKLICDEINIFIKETKD